VEDNYHANNLGRDIDNSGLPNKDRSPDGPVTFTEEDDNVD
jgi:hypothetical protein